MEAVILGIHLTTGMQGIELIITIFINIHCDAGRWEQFLRRCRLGESFNKTSRDKDIILKQIFKSKYVRMIIMMIIILYNIIRK